MSVPQHSAVLLTASVSQKEGAEQALAQAPSVTTFQVETAEPEQARQVPP